MKCSRYKMRVKTKIVFCVALVVFICLSCCEGYSASGLDEDYSSEGRPIPSADEDEGSKNTPTDSAADDEGDSSEGAIAASDEGDSSDHLIPVSNDDEEYQTKRPVPGANDRWSMDILSADDHSKEEMLDMAWELDGTLPMLDIEATSIIRSNPDKINSVSGIEISAFSARFLCEEVGRFLTQHISEERKLYSIHVPLENFQSLPRYESQCVTWISKSCKGKPSGAFDAQCIFWIPFLKYSGTATQCSAEPYLRRKKRMALAGNGAIVNAFDAVSLCRAIVNLQAFGFIDNIALKSNEVSQLRCYDFKQESESVWVPGKRQWGCENENKFRINTLITNLGVPPPVGPMRCTADADSVDCEFF